VRSFASVMVSVLMLALALSAVLPSAEAATTRAFTISTSTAHPQVDFRAFDADPPKAFDFNHDGRMELVLQNDNRWVYVFDSKSGKMLWEGTTHYPANWGARPLNGPEAAILKAGETPRMVIANSAAYVTSFRFDGVNADGTFRFTKEWEKRLSACHSNPGSDSRVAFADLDGDGDLEIVAQTEEVGVYALHRNGTIFWQKCIGGGNADPSIGDVNADGKPDVVFANDGGTVTAVNGQTGKTRWTYWVGNPIWNIGKGSMPVGPGIGQLDGLGGDDVVVGVKDKHNCTDFTQNHVALFAIRGNGTLMWMRQQNFSTPLSYTHAAIVDRNVYWMDWNTQGHKCGNYENVGKSSAYKYDSAGNLKWHTTLNAFWSNDDIAIADVDGDGKQEMLATCMASNGHEGICYLNTDTGAKEAFIDAWPWKVTRGPVVERLWGDGHMQWFLGVGAYSSTTSGGGVQVYDTGVAYSAKWPHLPYPNDGDDGAAAAPEPEPVPGNATEGNTTEVNPTAPPPPTTFDATFEVGPNINRWWVEVTVESDRSIAAVDARVDGGSWRALALTDWGTWAKSFNVPEGSAVQFRALDASGAEALSGTTTWP
jgi:outer membrane protein assembly factor BamB